MNEKQVIQQSSSNGPEQMPSVSRVFDHEKLDVYRIELQFVEWVADLLEEVARSGRARTSEACDQLDRASLSLLLNTAEGNGKRQRQVRAKFFDDARGSATECAACLDAMVAKRCATGERIREGKTMLVRIVSMLCKLVERFDTVGQLRDELGVVQTRFQPVAGTLSYRKKSRTRTRATTRRKV